MEAVKRKANEDFGEQIRKRLFGEKCLSGPIKPAVEAPVVKQEVIVSDKDDKKSLTKKKPLDNDRDNKSLTEKFKPADNDSNEALRVAIEKTKNAAKKALMSKDKEIDEIKGEILKHKLEKLTFQEKYKKYKGFAETLKKRLETSKVGEMSELISDLKCKTTLKDSLLHKEREENQKHMNLIVKLQERIAELSTSEKKVEEERVKDIIKHSDKVNQLEEKIKVLSEKLSKIKDERKSKEKESVPMAKRSGSKGRKADEEKLVAKIEPFMPAVQEGRGTVTLKKGETLPLVSPDVSSLETPLKIPKGKLDKKEYFESLLLLNAEPDIEITKSSENPDSVQECESEVNAAVASITSDDKQTNKSQSGDKQINKLTGDQSEHKILQDYSPASACQGIMITADENVDSTGPEGVKLKPSTEKDEMANISERKEFVEVLLLENANPKAEEMDFSICEEDALAPDNSESESIERLENIEASTGNQKEPLEKMENLTESTRKVPEKDEKVEAIEPTQVAYDELLKRINEKLVEMAKKKKESEMEKL